MAAHTDISRPLVRTIRVTGQVQGVGFRPFVFRLARELKLSGTVRNDPRGVTIEAIGLPDVLDAFQARVRDDAPALARVDEITTLAEHSANGFQPGFRIISSDREPAQRGRVTVDSAVCDDCLSELFDERDHRHRHGLINCTNCGPRYSIVQDLPYDRPLTTMAAFEMCGRCAAEYTNPADRRFHAQPVCCPDCGPQVTLVNRDGNQIDGDPYAQAATILRNGGIIAMKGLGGFHLAVDACNEHAVRKLRQAKQRDHKPFAMMVRDIAAATDLVELSADAEALLRSPICPIVLAPRKGSSTAIAAPVAEDAHRFGVMVPHTPMQHLLFAEGLGPLVMTSANRCDDPLIKDDDEAMRELMPLCDALLTHDRPIERAVDDSIVIDAPQGVLPTRRARGYVPTPIILPIAADRLGLCVGGELKNAVAIVRGDHVVLSQHIGDLSYTLAYQRFERTIDDLQRLFDVRPQWIACDAHPGYLSQRFAKRMARERDLELIVVQHHHAHLASLLADHGRTDRIVGVICDGVGYGDDGQAWGGEIMVGDLSGYERIARLRPLRLPGGDAAARQTGRCALSWLADVLGGVKAIPDALAARLIDAERDRSIVLDLLESDINCPLSSGTGRLFDAAAALIGICAYNHYEAMSPMLLESAASRSRSHPSGRGLLSIIPDHKIDGLREIDHRPLLTAMLDRLERGMSKSDLAWLFHDALADGFARAAVAIARRNDIATIGLSGGVFCNTLLTDLMRQRLSGAGLEVLVHRDVPPNDGGLAVGQAATAACITINANR